MAGLGAANAAEPTDYRLFVCSNIFIGPGPGDEAFAVTSSQVPEEIGQLCEDVLNALGARGFKLNRIEPAIHGGRHYMERVGRS